MNYAREYSANLLLVKEIEKSYKIDLKKRLFYFSADTLRLLAKIPAGKEFDVLRYQLAKSATAIGANYEESQATSYAEFRQRIKICLREANETSYWLRLIE